jgi:peptidoglycan pentaglycine glycine transferase (the first glycine)
MKILEIGDRDQWNGIIVSFPEYHLRQGWEWGEVERAEGAEVYRYAVVDGGRPVAAISIATARFPRMRLPLLYATRGPLMEWTNPLAWDGLQQAIREIAERSNAVFLRVSPDVPYTESIVRDGLVSNHFRQLSDLRLAWGSTRTSMTMPLNLPEAELKERMRKKCARYLERAVQKGAEIKTDCSAGSLKRFYKLYQEAGTRRDFPFYGFEHIARLGRHYLSKGDGCLVLVSHGGVDLSTVLFLRCGRKAYQMHVGNDETSPLGRELRAGIAAHWRALQWANASGCESADWGWSMTGFPPQPQDEHYSIYQFKVGFGCSIRYLTGNYDMVFRPSLYRACRSAEARLLPLARRIRARLNNWFDGSQPEIAKDPAGSASHVA